MLFYFGHLSQLYLLMLVASFLIPLTEQECGTVHLSPEKIIILKDRISVNEDEFESLHIRKINKAVKVSPVVVNGRQCRIRICGFTSMTDETHEGFIGNGNDIMDCQHFDKPNTANQRTMFNDRFNTSSISCGCYKEKANCATDCSHKIHSHVWKKNECAILYQEVDCRGDCYFDSISLQDGESYRPDHSHHIKSAIVRKDCYITQNLEGIRRLWMFKDSTNVILHFRENNSTDIPSAFQSDPETFNCSCDSNENEHSTTITNQPTHAITVDIESPETPSTLTLPVTPSPFVDTSTPPSRKEAFAPVATILVLTGLAVVGGTLIGLWVWKTKKPHSDSEVSRIFPGWSVLYKCSFEDADLPLATESRPSSSNEESLFTNPILEEDNAFQQDVQNVDSRIDNMDNDREQYMMEELKKYVQNLLKSYKSPDFETNPETDFNVMNHFNAICKEEFQLRHDSFTIGEKLGSGYFGDVYKSTIMQDYNDGLEREAAVKTLKLHARTKMVKSFLREIEIFQRIGSHMYVVDFFGASCHKGELCILTKFCENGSLRDYLNNNMRSKLIPSLQEENSYFEANILMEDLYQLLFWSEQIAAGMKYISAKKIIHVDLAVRNILLDAELTIKICDFGLSKECLEESDYASFLSVVFPFNSVAPECFNEKGENKISVFLDIWSYGCTIWEIFSFGERPYFGMDINGIKKMLLDNNRLPQPQLAPDYVYNMLIQCWNAVPQQRPAFSELEDFFGEKKNTLGDH